MSEEAPWLDDPIAGNAGGTAVAPAPWESDPIVAKPAWEDDPIVSQAAPPAAPPSSAPESQPADAVSQPWLNDPIATPQTAPAQVAQQPQAEPSVYDTIRANDAAAKAQGVDPFTLNQQRSAEMDVANRPDTAFTAIGKSYPVRVATGAVQGVGESVGGAILTGLAQVNPKFQDAAEYVYNEGRSRQAVDNYLNAGSTLKNAIQGGVDILAQAAPAASLGLPGLAAYFGGTTAARTLTEAEQKGTSTSDAYAQAATHGTIDAVWTLLGGKFLGSTIGKLAGAEGEGILSKIAGKLTEKLKLPSWSKVVGTAAEGAAGQVAQGVGMSASHYLGGVATGEHEFNRDDFYNAMESTVLPSLVAAVGGEAIHAIPKVREYIGGIADTIEQRAKELPKAVEQAAKEPAKTDDFQWSAAEDDLKGKLQSIQPTGDPQKDGFAVGQLISDVAKKHGVDIQELHDRVIAPAGAEVTQPPTEQTNGNEPTNGLVPNSGGPEGSDQQQAEAASNGQAAAVQQEGAPAPAGEASGNSDQQQPALLEPSPQQPAVSNPPPPEPPAASNAPPEHLLLPDHPVEPVAVSDLSEPNPDRFQFRHNTDERGLIEGNGLPGAYDPQQAGALLVWEDKNGNKHVVNGFSRLDLAQRSGEPEVNAQVLRAKDGVTADKAAAIGAQQNLLEGRGTVHDYAEFFRQTKITEAQAKARGLLESDEGKNGFLVGKFANAKTWDAYHQGKIPIEEALNSPSVQRRRGNDTASRGVEPDAQVADFSPPDAKMLDANKAIDQSAEPHDVFETAPKLLNEEHGYVDSDGFWVDTTPPAERTPPTKKELSKHNQELKKLRESGVLPDGFDNLDYHDQRGILDEAKTRQREGNAYLSSVRQQYREVFGNDKRSGFRSARAKKAAGRGGDEESVKGFDYISSSLAEDKYADLQAESSKLGHGDANSGILRMQAGGAKQFANKPLDEYISRVHDEYQTAKEREAASSQSGAAPEDQGAPGSGRGVSGRGIESPAPRSEEVPQAESAVAPFSLSREAPPAPPTAFENTTGKQPDLIPDMWRNAAPGQTGLFEEPAAEQPPTAKPRRPAITADQLTEQIKSAATSPEEAGAISSLINAFAEYRGETPDEYVSKHIAGVEKGPETESRYLKQHGDRPAPGTIGPGGDVLAQAGEQTDTPEFKRWFGDSKAVDESGKPLTLYHGTGEPVTQFDNPHAQDLGGRWHMLSTSPEYASEFADAAGRGGNVIAAHVKAEKPLDLSTLPAQRGDARSKLLRLLENKGFDVEKLRKVLPFGRDLYQHINNRDSRAELVRQLEDRGYDSIIMPDNRAHVVDNKLEHITANTWIVLDPQQIKSATGNRGTFDPTNPSILAQGEGKRAVRGETQFLSDGRAIIRAFQENQNVATLAHEVGHVFRRTLLPEELAKTEAALGVEGGKWKRENEERFARMFERYLREGKAPTKPLRAVFEKFKNWLTSVYQNLAKSPLAKDIPPQLREVFDTMLGAKGEAQLPPTESNGPETLAQPGGTTGIAHRVEEARRESLGQSEPQRGQGISAEDSVARGRSLLAQGQSPEAAVADFQKTGAISSDGIALVRAKHEELAQAAHKALDEAGQNENDPAFKAAEKARRDWWQNAVKPMQTEWHRAGMAQQGETDIDTGSFYGLQRAFQEQTGKEMKPVQVKEAKRRSADVAKAKVEEDDVNRKLQELVNAQEPGAPPVDNTQREQAHQQLIKEVDAGPKKYAPVVLKWAEKFTSWLDKHAESSLARFKKKHSSSTLDLSNDVLAQDETPLDSEDITDLTVFTAAKIARGLKNKAAWSKMMLTDAGEIVRPHLDDIWKAAHETLETNLKEFVKDKPTAKKVKKALAEGVTPATFSDKPFGETSGRVAQMRVEGIAAEASPDMTPHQLANKAKELSREFIRQGISEREANVDAVHAELSKKIPGLSRENTADAMSGYGDYKLLNKEDPAENRRREIAGEIQQTRKLQDMAAKKIPKVSGSERAEQSAEYRRLTKQVNEAKRKGAAEGWFKAANSDRQTKSALDAMKTRAENRITDLLNELAKGEKAVKERKAPPTNPQLEALREELASVKGWHDNVFGKESRKLTDEQRLTAATKATEKNLQDLERRVAEKDFTEKKNSPVSSPQLDALRARVQEERARLAELRGLDPAAARSDAQKADASWLRQLASQNAKLADQIATKDFAKNGASSRVTFSPEVKAARDQNTALREQANSAAWMQTVQGHDPAAKWTNDEVASLWKMAKANYTDKGVANLKEIAKGLSTDTGLPADVILRGLGQLKGAREVTNELYAKQSARRRADLAAKRWLVDADTPRVLKTLKAIPGGLFAMKIGAGLHGTVGMVTHAIPSAFSIPGSAQWRAYFRNFGKQFPLSFSRAYHEREMQAMELRDNYLTAQRAGLKTNPDSTYGEYELAAKLLGKLGMPSGNGFDSLKIMRQDLFDIAWNKLPDSLKNPEMAKHVALMANHLTGAGENIAGTGVGGKIADVALFAPRLEGARAGLAVGDPAVMAKRFLNWKNETPEARHAALMVLKQSATMAGVYLTYLAVNQAMLSASKSDDDINFTDPTKSDWLSFKVAGHNIGVIGPLLTPFRLMANAITDLRNHSDNTVKQIRGKLSPFGKLVVDPLVGSDFSGRPLPFSSRPVPKNLAEKGVGPLSWGEYVTETFLPIPMEDATKEVWNDQGIASNKAEDYLKAIEAAAAGMIGVNIRDIPPPKPVKIGKPVSALQGPKQAKTPLEKAMEAQQRALSH